MSNKTSTAPVIIPKQQLIKHWSKYASAVLEWLKGRPVTLEAVYNGKVVYRRYTDKTHKELIRINTADEVIVWARRHVYSFHPYICHPKQQAPCWYVLDIDPEENVPFKITTKLTTFIVNKLRILYPDKRIDVAFCGKNGYHIFMWLSTTKQTRLFRLSKDLTLQLAEFIATETPLLKAINLDFTSTEEQTRFQAFLQANNLTENHRYTIKLDTRILHRFANIRSPYSIHPYTGKMSRLVVMG